MPTREGARRPPLTAEQRRDIVAIDKQRIWHPYTEMSRYREQVDPLVVVRAEGSILYDADGRSYLDANASWWTSNLGHNHPRLVEAVRRQSGSLCHTALAGITHPAATDLAEALCTAAPEGLEHVFFSDNGSTAVEVAMKIVLQYWQQNGRPDRRVFISLENAFHGETLGVTALGGVDVFRKPFQGSLLECIHVPSPAVPGELEGAIEALASSVENQADRLAGVVLEPMVQGAAGMQVYDAAYLRAARKLCDQHDVFLICDEVFAGYGRTGRMWASEHGNLRPDLLCAAKAFSGGMFPMAATLTTERIFEGFLGERERAFHYGHSFCGNPLGAAVAREVLQVFDDERILDAAVPKSRRLAQAFLELEDLPGVGRARSLGMLAAVDLASEEEGYHSDVGWRVYDEARKRGAYLRPLGNVIYATPALNIPDEDLERLLAIVKESVAAVMTEP